VCFVRWVCVCVYYTHNIYILHTQNVCDKRHLCANPGILLPCFVFETLPYLLQVLPRYKLGSVRGRTGFTGPTTNTARLSSRYKGKTRGCHCSHWAPDDGRENARNMLCCKQTSG
jgi:hypothetical protein